MALESVLAWYVELIAKLIDRLEVSAGPFGVSLRLKEEAEKSADERLALIDAARTNLAQGIQAIDELRKEAADNKKKIEDAAAQLARLQSDKESLEHQRDEVKKLVATDITTFQQLAGVPSPAAIRRERFIGFASGIIASVVASGVVWGLKQLYDHFH